MLWKMFSGSTMTPTTHGIREGSKADNPDEEAKAKEREKDEAKAEEEEDFSDPEGKEKEKEREEKEEPTWWEKMKKKNGKTQKTMRHGKTAIGPKMRTGMKAIGPMKICTTRMSMDISREKEKVKEKARKERKARMMKAKVASQEMEKENPTMCSHSHNFFLLLNNKRITPQQHQQVMVS